jgi:hypothetical protein
MLVVCSALANKISQSRRRLLPLFLLVVEQRRQPNQSLEPFPSEEQAVRNNQLPIKTQQQPHPLHLVEDPTARLLHLALAAQLVVPLLAQVCLHLEVLPLQMLVAPHNQTPMLALILARRQQFRVPQHKVECSSLAALLLHP